MHVVEVCNDLARMLQSFSDKDDNKGNEVANEVD